ncbi:hypothetical protein K437DRAFT_258293 [Tilletiaria anomala UBC 951]|uniref:Uncharacterized protein n=1 Tax=Tilletiaria anomala (strain ATCC 24038 / CBS 436.72 / UBC 951) TaxID=1037660 RepID=A0A066VI98_TILAU|nr:uncharacterized protein K437DRAFT_258293 [Tilletiaria anomala UBC 951]KDN41442.1 hypothetical protein K437DRAFT_258293 [Tilletiaria anomala UBC 951]
MKGARNSKLEDNFVIEEDTNSDIADQDDLALSSDVSSLSDSDSSVPAPKKRKIQKWNGKTQGQTVGSSANERRSTKPSGNGPGRTVITLAKAPSKQPPPHIISDTMMNFLSSLKDPANNDRDWFQQHDALYRYAWDNWNAFVTVLLPRLMEEADETLPFLPTKDMVYRIYRDVRFSSDKTPYKTYMSATFSRGGRKGAYAGYHLEVKPGSQSFIAGGRWCPEKEHLQIFRQHIIDDDEEGRRFKEILNGSDFKNFFGPAKPGGRGLGRSSSVFGHSDELKVAPKMPGVDKNHPQIDWLKLRSFYVSRTWVTVECSERVRNLLIRFSTVLSFSNL